MRATRKWIKYTVSGGIICFACTLYLLCMMAPPGMHLTHRPPGGQGEKLLNIQERPLVRTNAFKTTRMLPLGGHVRSTSSDHQLVAELWPKSKDDEITKAKQGSNENAHEPVCQNDCQRLEELFSSWPASKPKAMLYYLTKSSRLEELKESLQSVERNFNQIYNYPIVIFHESDLSPEIPTIRKWTNSSLFFQIVSFALPNFLLKKVEEDIECWSSIGYRHMCRFQAKLVYEYPITQWADYAWRFDDESILTKPVGYDVFQFMRKKQLLYGYIWEHRDAMSCVTGLWEATEQYIHKFNIPPNRFPQWKSPKLYYNNFEISSMALWRSKEYRSFIDYLDRLGGIYYHRWGDAPMKGIAVSLFVPKNQLHYFKDIGYRHNTFHNPSD